MAQNNTIFQRLTNAVIGAGNGTMRTPTTQTITYNLKPKDKVIASFTNKEDRDKKLAQLKQQRFLSYQWNKIGYDTQMKNMANATQVSVMYRDADLMDQWPEINAGLHILSEEATTINAKGKMLNVYSKSERIQSILEDLFYNRLDCNVMLPMITRATCKYGNEFMFLNLDQDLGVKGWKELPVHEMKRLENGLGSMFSGAFNGSLYNLQPDETKFVWMGHNESMPFRNWQVAHFRLIKDSTFLPYGVSWLNGARRHWRMLSMMEDAMLIYRLERSIERRVFKVNVGAIDDEDVPAFLDEFMNGVKRAPIIDPTTGQVDLRKNFLDVSADYVIPVRPGADPSAIETLQAATNQTSMEDIDLMINHILSMLRIPKSFLNFQEAQGKGQNLGLMDVRFNRTVNSIQQAILMELNKIAIIHLFLLGFDETEQTNFTLSLNNPSNQIEMMELDNWTKRLAAAAAALAEQGGGLPIMSWKQTQKEIMGRTDSEIYQMLNDIRLESALAAELQQTSQIIKRTGLYDKTDRIYGEPGAKYSEAPQGEGGAGPMSGGGGAPLMGGPSGGFGDDLGGDELGDLGEPGAETEGDINGAEGGENLSNMGGAEPLQESGRTLPFFEKYRQEFFTNETPVNRVPVINNALLINEEIDNIIKDIERIEKKADNILKK